VMARNLGTSECQKCDYKVRLSDIRGKPVEFRRYGPYAPVIGVRFDCACGEVYFASFGVEYKVWSRDALASGAWKEETLRFPNGVAMKNVNCGRFAVERVFKGQVHAENTGAFTVDLSYYETYDDEPMADGDVRTKIRSGEMQPLHLCVDDAEDVER